MYGYGASSAGEVIAGLLESGIFGLGPRAAQERRRRQGQRWDNRFQRQGTKQSLRGQAQLERLISKLGLASQLGVKPADGMTGGPPALVDTPYGPMPAQSGNVAQAKIYPLGSTTIVGGAVGTPVAGQLAVRSEESFRPTRLVLIASIEGVVDVSDISVGAKRQLANLEVMPVEAFDRQVTAAWIDFDIITPGRNASVDLIYTPVTLNTNVRVSGMYYGTEL